MDIEKRKEMSMKQVTKEELKKYANQLMFDLEDQEYDNLMDEFQVILKQMDLIAKIDGIEQVEPMSFPYERMVEHYRNDDTSNLSKKEVLLNAKKQNGNHVIVPKVVN